MTDARVGREAVVVPVSDSDPDARLGREGLVVPHSLPGSAVDARVGRVVGYVAISRPGGWDVFDDPAL